jgi:uncharacterized protein
MMFSLQRLLSGEDKAFDLMDGSAEEARAAIVSLIAMLRAPADQRRLDAFVAARRKEKLLAQHLTEYLCKTFVTPLEREDMEALSKALYKIPKTAEKFAERYLLAGELTRGIELAAHLKLLEEAAEMIVAMVKVLRKGAQLEDVRRQNERLQQVEGEGDKLMLASLRDLYEGQHDPFQILLAKDLFELLEKVFDRCRDVGNVVFHIILKYA